MCVLFAAFSLSPEVKKHGEQNSVLLCSVQKGLKSKREFTLYRAGEKQMEKIPGAQNFVIQNKVVL